MKNFTFIFVFFLKTMIYCLNNNNNNSITSETISLKNPKNKIISKSQKNDLLKSQNSTNIPKEILKLKIPNKKKQNNTISINPKESKESKESKEKNFIDKELNLNKLEAISKAFTTIFLAGLFDKSFFITAILAMKYSNIIVICSATFSLSLIGIISVFLGLTVNKYIPAIYIDIFSVLLFLVFGASMIYDGMQLKENDNFENLENSILNEEEKKEILGEENAKNENANNENENNFNDIDNEICLKCNKDNIDNFKNYKNLNEKIEGENKGLISENNQNNNNNLCRLCNNSLLNSFSETKANSKDSLSVIDNNKNKTKNNNKSQNDLSNSNLNNSNMNNSNYSNNSNNSKKKAKSKLLKNFQAFSKTFFLIFCGEIGDRSQISTIYLTANFDKFVVITAVISSSFILTLFAVYGGKLISNRVSEKKLTIFAGFIFILFAFFAAIFIDKNDFMNIFYSNNNKNKDTKGNNDNNFLAKF